MAETIENKEKKNSGSVLIISGAILFFIWILLVFSGSNFLFYFRWWAWPIWSFLIFWGLATKNIFWTFVDEGTAKVVVKGGEFVKSLIQWQGWTFIGEGNTFADCWEVVKETPDNPEPWHFLGGLRFYGIWPIWQIYRYKFRWQDIQLVQGEERPEFHEEILDYVLVKPAVYSTTIKKAETASPERIPLDIQFLITIRAVNPYKVLFVGPPNWLEKVLARLNALLRGWIGSQKLDDLLALQKVNPAAVWNELKEDPRVLSFEEEWGIKIEENGIEMRDIGLPEDIQEAAAAEKKMRLKAAGTASETIGTIIESMAQIRGSTVDEVKEQIRNDPSLQKLFLEMATDFLSRRMAIDGGAFVDIRTSGPKSQGVAGSQGIKEIILELMAAWKRMPTGQGGQGGQGDQGKQISDEEFKKIRDKILKEEEEERKKQQKKKN